jgi:hypothetical protein
MSSNAGRGELLQRLVLQLIEARRTAAEASDELVGHFLNMALEEASTQLIHMRFERRPMDSARIERSEQTHNAGEGADAA